MWAQEEESELRLRRRARRGARVEVEVDCGNIPSRRLIPHHRPSFEDRCSYSDVGVFLIASALAKRAMSLPID